MSWPESGAHLDVGDGHRIWVATQGRRDGVPCLFLHGGPGSGCNAGQQKLFDPERHYAVFVDQRGAGRSEPKRERLANTTAHLVADLEAVREALAIERWMVVGGSWGATLALAYAEAHPHRVTGLALRSVFLGTAAELDWAFGTALPAFQPALHARLAETGQGGLADLWTRILDDDPEVHAPAARAFFAAERALSELNPPSTPRGTGPLPATPFMEAHYFSQGCFLADDALIRGAGSLSGLPGIIVQARLDLLCPPATSARLAAAWPDARVESVEAAGHSLGHPTVFEALRAAVQELAV